MLADKAINEVADNVPADNVPIEGTVHFNIWLRTPGVPAPGFVKAWDNEPWPEFIAGYHVDIRQPSRLRTLCTPIHTPENT